MNIEQFRHDMIEAMARQGLNANRLAQLAHVQQSSLYNFINKQALLSGKFVLRLLPYVYDRLPPSPVSPTPEESEAHHAD